MQGISVVDANLVVYLHPSKSRNHSQAILCELGSSLFNFDKEILHIIGSMVPGYTGSIRWLDRNFDEVSEFDRSATKSRDGERLEEKIADEGATSLSNNNHIKDSKKRRIAK